VNPPKATDRLEFRPLRRDDLDDLAALLGARAAPPER